jgi:hypothetical protein
VGAAEGRATGQLQPRPGDDGGVRFVGQR